MLGGTPQHAAARRTALVKLGEELLEVVVAPREPIVYSIFRRVLIERIRCVGGKLGQEGALSSGRRAASESVASSKRGGRGAAAT